MKITSTLLLLTFFSLTVNSQSLKMTTGYSLGIPMGDMGKNIQPAHSFQMGVAYQLPGKLSHLSITSEFGIGLYASKRIDQTFQFGNNAPTTVPVTYNSNVFNANIGARWNLLPDDYLVNPYLQIKGGLYNFFSNIYVEDPDDPGGCHALQQKNIINDNTFYWSAGGGLQLNTGVFDREKLPSRVTIDLGVNTVRGGTLNYINTKHLLDAQDATNNNNNGGKPVSVQFINASTQEIHEHTVAQVYTSPLCMLEFRVGVILGIGTCGH